MIEPVPCVVKGCPYQATYVTVVRTCRTHASALHVGGKQLPDGCVIRGCTRNAVGYSIVPSCPEHPHNFGDLTEIYDDAHDEYYDEHLDDDITPEQLDCNAEEAGWAAAYREALATFARVPDPEKAARETIRLIQDNLATTPEPMHTPPAPMHSPPVAATGWNRGCITTTVAIIAILLLVVLFG